MIDLVHDNLAALIVVVPLIGGVLCVFTGKGLKPWLWATAVTAVVFALSLALLFRPPIQEGSAISYPMGGWANPFGIELRPDTLSAFVVAVVSFIALVATIYARQSVAKEIHGQRVPYFYSLWILALTGLLGITMTGDAFNVYVLLEISSLTVYALVALGKDIDRRALTAAFNYLILGSTGATFILLGIGYLYMATGTLNIAEMHTQLARLALDGESRTVIAGSAFLMVGLSLKMALFPLHIWLPDAYTYAPSAVSAFVAATATKVGVYMTFRFMFTIFGDAWMLLRMFDNVVLMACGCMAIVLGSLQAVRQSNIKRMLAFSSVAQIGYIVLGFAMSNEAGIQGSIVHVLNHALTKGGLFMAVGCVAYRLGATRLEQFRGLGRRMPWTMAAFTVGGLGLIGIPLTAGFISKWYLIQGALADELWPLAVVVLIGSVLALVYVWRVVEVIYLSEPDDSTKHATEAPLGMLIPTWILIGGSIYFGVNATHTSELAGTAARMLLGTN